jgi:hypothetical protein
LFVLYSWQISKLKSLDLTPNPLSKGEGLVDLTISKQVFFLFRKNNLKVKNIWSEMLPNGMLMNGLRRNDDATEN